MNAFHTIPRTVLYGRLAHLKKQNEILVNAMAAYIAAVEARRALPADSRVEANQRVRIAYDALARHAQPQPKTKVKKLDTLQLSLL
jgi:hypothetical protein